MKSSLLLLPLALVSGIACARATIELPSTTITGIASASRGVDLDVPVSTGSRLGLTSRQNPASVSVANQQQIERVGARHFQEAANSLPGVLAADPPGFGGNIAYRGFSGVQVNQLFNGISLQSSAALRPVDSWIYDRVELIGGPSSFAHGSGSVGGTFNYVTKLATSEDLPGELRLRYGGFDRYELAVGTNQALNSGPGARHYARVDVSHGGSNDFIDRQERTTSNLAFSLLSVLNDQLSHTLALEYLEDQEDSPYWGTPILNPRAGRQRIDRRHRFNNYNVADGRYEQRTRWLRSITDYRLAPGNRLRNTAYHYRGQRDYRNLESYTYLPDNSAINRSAALLQRHDQELNGNRVEWMVDTSLLGLPADWALGADVSRNRQLRFPRSISAVADTVDPNGFSPGSFDDIPGMTRGWVKGRTNLVDNRALFAENRLQVLPSLSVVSALRYDHIDWEVVNHRTVTPTDPARYSRRWDALSGRLGLVWDVTDSVTSYVQYSNSVQPPSGVLTSTSFTGVRDFDLSTGSQWEIGSKFDFWDQRGSATVALYRIVRKDFPIADANNPGETQPVGQQTSDGVELNASLKLTEQLLLEGNVALIDARFDTFNETAGGATISRKGKRPSNTPDRIANLWLTYDLNPQWRTGLDARHVSSVYADNANTRWAPAYTLYSAFVRYRVTDNADVTLRGRNLTDEQYARFISSQYYLGEPRNVDLTLQMRF
ncbi:TonB-dependent receptor [Pseudomonas sp.]|uniref:TonB-dependent receptor n=1 Tax=Pseudomonas sp. TaxID=306 RepID=UPI00272B6CD5|nr:TonB-dependent receptor [Pseudomonas sp.]